MENKSTKRLKVTFALGLMIAVFYAVGRLASSGPSAESDQLAPAAPVSAETEARVPAKSENVESGVLLPLPSIPSSDEEAQCFSEQGEIYDVSPSDGSINGNILHNTSEAYSEFKRQEIRANYRLRYSLSGGQINRYGKAFSETISDDENLEVWSQNQLAASIIAHRPGTEVACQADQVFLVSRPLDAIDGILMAGRSGAGQILKEYKEELQVAQEGAESAETHGMDPSLTSRQSNDRGEMLSRARSLVQEAVQLKGEGELLSAYLLILDARATTDAIKELDCS